MEFKMITSSDINNFERNVNKALTEGWELHGCTSTTSSGSSSFMSIRFSQAMIRKK